MTSAAVQQMWMNVSEVNDAVLASSLEALPSPTDAGVDSKSHVRECGLHTVVDEVKDGVLHISTGLVLVNSPSLASPFTG